MKKIFLVTAFIGASIAAGAQSLKPVAYNDAAQKLNGLVTSNAGKKLPGVLVLPAWKGIDQESKDAAIALAKQGYIAFVADIYGEGNIPADNNAAAKAAGSYRKDYAAYQKRIEVALAQLKAAGADPNNIAVIGYCFGGTGALEAARANFPLKGVVAIHGGLAKDSARANGPLPLKILVENGAEDGSVTPQIMKSLEKEMNEGKADWQVITYAYSKHTFTDPASPDYNKVMADRAWQHTLLFLKEILK
ncbi:dienelactone hydrolase [Chitinophaga skermanii]|uniref:Dienelactone hydrolase n=1 Tax=Chitinophaga skermanii TaxID=331697 RepID=A0A327QN39_9BACT|nr:dienelactone hydrolase family protein [Chitinophaga skermanii]RAJ05458.1 dienelactone hydrolase [Chitinophaga skermanii]